MRNTFTTPNSEQILYASAEGTLFKGQSTVDIELQTFEERFFASINGNVRKSSPGMPLFPPIQEFPSSRPPTMNRKLWRRLQANPTWWAVLQHYPTAWQRR